MDGFKQRIIGAVVLVSLAVIFIPMIFEDPHQEKSTEVLQIPAQPEVPAFTIESPQPPVRQQSGDGIPRSAANPALTGSGSEYTNAPVAITESATSEQLAETDDEGRQAIQMDELASSDSMITGGVGRRISDESERIVTPEPEAINNSEQVAEVAGVDSPRAAISENAWVVQIGTFKNRPGAVRIRDELRKSGTPSYTTDIVSGDIPMVRVFAGPTETKDAALELKEKVDERYKLQSMVLAYKEP